MTLPRKADGSLPDITFMHLVAGSDLVNAGLDVGLPFIGPAPDLGAFEAPEPATLPFLALSAAALLLRREKKTLHRLGHGAFTKS